MLDRLIVDIHAPDGMPTYKYSPTSSPTVHSRPPVDEQEPRATPGPQSHLVTM